jgi:hypothetical protein
MYSALSSAADDQERKVKIDNQTEFKPEDS